VDMEVLKGVMEQVFLVQLDLQTLELKALHKEVKLDMVVVEKLVMAEVVDTEQVFLVQVELLAQEHKASIKGAELEGDMEVLEVVMEQAFLVQLDLLTLEPKALHKEVKLDMVVAEKLAMEEVVDTEQAFLDLVHRLGQIL